MFLVSILLISQVNISLKPTDVPVISIELDDGFSVMEWDVRTPLELPHRSMDDGKSLVFRPGDATEIVVDCRLINWETRDFRRERFVVSLDAPRPPPSPPKPDNPQPPKPDEPDPEPPNPQPNPDGFRGFTKMAMAWAVAISKTNQRHAKDLADIFENVGERIQSGDVNIRYASAQIGLQDLHARKNVLLENSAGKFEWEIFFKLFYAELQKVLDENISRKELAKLLAAVAQGLRLL